MTRRAFSFLEQSPPCTVAGMVPVFLEDVMAAKKKAKKKGTARKAAKKSARKTTAKKTPAKKKARKASGKAATAKTKAPKKAPARKQIKGEGDYEASRSFLKDQAGFVKKNRSRIPALGKEARAALEGAEGPALMAAEAEARSHGKGEAED